MVSFFVNVPLQHNSVFDDAATAGRDQLAATMASLRCARRSQRRECGEAGATVDQRAAEHA